MIDEAFMVAERTHTHIHTPTHTHTHTHTYHIEGNIFFRIMFAIKVVVTKFIYFVANKSFWVASLKKPLFHSILMKSVTKEHIQDNLNL